MTVPERHVPSPAPMTAPALRATYRVQLHAGFTFDAAAAIVPYLARLGISHLYVSPILQAAPGSTHGYDVIDHGALNAELGGADGFGRLTDALAAHGLGLVVDVVPNHMAISGEQNRWWWDLLEHGPASRYADHFDVDWDPPESRLRNVILLPVLPDHYGRVLEAGEIRLARDGGRLLVEHGERRFPVDPSTIGPIVAAAGRAAGSDELAFVGAALGELPSSTTSDRELVARRQRDADVLGARLAELLAADPAIAAALDVEVAGLDAEVERLDALLEAQNYRLAFWRAASRDLGYRRFFDIDELVGLRMEDERVFARTHELILRLVDDGLIDGLRIDHPDGLRDPAGYFERLRAAAPDAWIVAEKILELHEPLPVSWAIDGTTGYRFANLATGVLVDAAGEAPLSAAWDAVADAGPGWEELVHDARVDVLGSVLGSDVNRLADLFLAVCEANRRYRDFTRHELHQALREVAAAMPVYRSYVRARDGLVTDADRATIGAAVAAATAARPDLDPELFTLLQRILSLEVDGRLAGELAMRFQQLTPAAMAKGVEDTAFYRHHRLVALNEVGGDPGRFGTDVAAFHAAILADAPWPRTMRTLSTHDTKRSADVRARLVQLAADPMAWTAAVERLHIASEPHRTGPELPTAADAYLLFQVVVGAWPIDADRTAAYMAKATKEAKLRTSWTAPDEAYDAAVERLVRGALGDPTFRAAVDDVAAPLLEPGRVAALAQLLLQLTVPGVPDVYQGSELWDLSLVDPDNRRPVDYRARDALLAEVLGMDAPAAAARLQDGVAKLWLLQRALALRERRPDVLGPAAAYEPLAFSGRQADAMLGFVRGAAAISIVPRLPLRIARDGWGDTAVELPPGRWTGLDGARHAGRTDLADLTATFPVALLERDA